VNSDEKSLSLLKQAVERLDAALVPWGFHFQIEKSGYSSPGGFAAGYYVRGSTRIGLIYRAAQGLGGVVYEQDVFEENGCVRSRITYSIEHPGYMLRIGHQDDCHLIERGISSVERNGDDPVGALIFDLTEFAAPTLQSEPKAFFNILLTGQRRRVIFWLV
jgi:hypothetical protein